MSSLGQQYTSLFWRLPRPENGAREADSLLGHLLLITSTAAVTRILSSSAVTSIHKLVHPSLVITEGAESDSFLNNQRAGQSSRSFGNLESPEGSRTRRKSAKVVTMSLEGGPPPPRQLVTAWGCEADPPPSSDSLGVRS